jgi:1-aminocyclopropane-1-carboxylate deaminase/D-cysteine desulfhydrase-like pyridoxal-dependent ACC family enzyme
VSSLSQERRYEQQRRSLTPLPTPLDRAPGFSAAVGREVLIKRDDIGSIGNAGNKIRKLEYLVQKADVDGVEAFTVVGAAQSNAARAVATVAAATGRRCVIVVPEEPQAADQAEGNLLLSLLFGAEVRFIGRCDWPEAEAAAGEIAREIQAEGQRCLPLPVGCSSPLGVLGFVAAHRELLSQLEDLGCAASAIVHASSSGGTAAGLHLGRMLHGGPPVLSIDVGPIFEDVAAKIASLASAAAELLATSHRFTPEQIEVIFDFAGAGYAQPSEDGLAAIRLLARTEGILCDAVYSGKALAAVCAGVASQGESPVVFWHTGGAQATMTRALGHLLLSG